jgi:hypothetical protein
VSLSWILTPRALPRRRSAVGDRWLAAPHSFSPSPAAGASRTAWGGLRSAVRLRPPPRGYVPLRSPPDQLIVPVHRRHGGAVRPSSL